MALSYGLTNPAAFKMSSESGPTILGYKIYVSSGGYLAAKESNDFGLTWSDCTYTASGGTSKCGLVYNSVNNKVVVVNNYSPYSGTALYSFYATPALNTATKFTRGTQRTQSPRDGSSGSRYNVYGSVFDYETNSIVGVRVDTYHNYSATPNYDYFITSDYLSPNTFATASLINTTGNRFNIVTGKNGINLEIQTNSSSKYGAKLFRFVKNSNTSYSKSVIASISASTLNIASTNYIDAAYLENIGFVIYYSPAGSGNAYSRLIRFDGTVSSTKDWGSKANYAISSNNYYSNRVYLARGNKVYYTTDGINWTTCSGTLPSALSAGSDGVVLLNTDDKIAVSLNTSGYWAVSTNGGNSFVQSTGNTSTVKYRPEHCNNTTAMGSAILVPIYS